MQSLISQITNLFATQSLNSLENNGLPSFSSASTDFGGLLEGFSNENYPANIAALNGNPLQTSHTPISFQITQFALTAQPGASDGAIEYSGQIVNATLKDNLQDLTDTRNLNADSQENIAYESTFSNNYINLTSVSNQGFDGGQQIASSTVANQIDNNVSVVVGLNNLASESIAKYQQVGQSQQAINVESENSVDNGSSLKNLVDTNFKDNTAKNNINVVNNDWSVTNNVSVNVLNESVVNDNAFVSKTTTPIKPLEQALTAYSVVPVDEKISKNSINANALPIDNKMPILSEATVSVPVTPLLKEHLVDKPIATEGKLEHRSAISDDQKFSNPVSSTQAATAEKAVIDDLPIDKLEVAAAKQVYNPLQQDQIKRVNNNARDETNNIRANALDREVFSDNFNQSVGKAEVGMGLTSTIKNQDITQDIKFTPNNVTIDKASINNPIAPEHLTVSNKISGLDRLPLQLDANNSVSNGDDLAQQIAWAKQGNINNIKIAISPEHLGALEINIENDADGLNIQFVTQNATAKEALETFMPRLKEMLEQNGLNLQNANVSQQDKGQGNNTGYSDAQDFISQSGGDEKFNVNSNSGDEPNAITAQANNRLLEAFA
jgi:flagellar hook-length control protein FliK